MVTTSGGRRAKGQVIDSERAVLHVSSRGGNWQDTPVAGVKQVPLRGDMESGPHACFIKFPAGVDHGWHDHTNGVSLVVLEGAYLFKDESGVEKRVGAGEYFFIPGGVKHWSGGDAAEGCVFYQEMSDRFDFNPID